MFEQLQQLWQMMQAGAASPNPDAAAAQLAQLGDPNALMAPLFSDAQQWSPTNFGQDMQVNLANSAQQLPGPMNPVPGFGGPEAPLMTFDKMLQQPQPQPQVNLANSAQMMDGSQRPAAQPSPNPGLTAQQYQQLMGMMPDQKGYVPPAPPPGRPTGQVGAMQMLNPGTLPQQRRPTLAELIYGGR